MAKEKVYVGSIGTEIIANTGVTITGATVSLLVMKPNGAKVTWDGDVYDTACVRHTTVAGDLDVPGDYLLQPQVLAADGSWEIPGATYKLHVFDRFE